MHVKRVQGLGCDDPNFKIEVEREGYKIECKNNYPFFRVPNPENENEVLLIAPE
jgi:hypothetical protein